MLLQDVVCEVGDIVLCYWWQDLQVWDKGGGVGLVSEVDLVVNVYFEMVFCVVCFDYGWFSEELFDELLWLDVVYCFIIDLIDGMCLFLDG